MRRMTILPLIAVTALLASGCDDDMLTPGPTEAAAQEAPAPGVGEATRRGPRFPGRPGEAPLARLLERREELGLTADQVARLETLADELTSRHEALRGRLEAERGERPDRPSREDLRRLSEEERAALREQMRARREALRPLLEQMRASHEETMAEVREILTDEQEAKLRELRGARRRGTGGRGRGAVNG